MLGTSPEPPRLNGAGGARSPLQQHRSRSSDTAPCPHPTPARPRTEPPVFPPTLNVRPPRPSLLPKQQSSRCIWVGRGGFRWSEPPSAGGLLGSRAASRGSPRLCIPPSSPSLSPWALPSPSPPLGPAFSPHRSPGGDKPHRPPHLRDHHCLPPSRFAASQPRCSPPANTHHMLLTGGFLRSRVGLSGGVSVQPSPPLGRRRSRVPAAEAGAVGVGSGFLRAPTAARKPFYRRAAAVIGSRRHCLPAARSFVWSQPLTPNLPQPLSSRIPSPHTPPGPPAPPTRPPTPTTCLCFPPCWQRACN